MNRRILKAVLQKAWYPEVVRCSLCHNTTHELTRMEYKIPYYGASVFKASACPDCYRDMERKVEGDRVDAR
jgi:C4-type Zn-finger protein